MCVCVCVRVCARACARVRVTYYLFVFVGCMIQRPFVYSSYYERSITSVLDRLVGLVVKASASRAEDPGFQSRLRRDFSGVESDH